MASSTPFTIHTTLVFESKQEKIIMVKVKHPQSYSSDHPFWKEAANVMKELPVEKKTAFERSLAAHREYSGTNEMQPAIFLVNMEAILSPAEAEWRLRAAKACLTGIRRPIHEMDRPFESFQMDGSFYNKLHEWNLEVVAMQYKSAGPSFH